MKMKFNLKTFNFALCLALICSVFLSLAQFDVACEELRQNVLRLHIIANSDSETDQTLKLKVRDGILNSSGDLFTTTDNIYSAIMTVENNLDELKGIADAIIKQNGFSYDVEVRVGKSYFETREYDDFTLPAGEYDSLIITIGEGRGKNWWCVIFPEICLPVAIDRSSLEDVVCDETVEVAEHPQKYVARFKFIEIYEDLKNFVKR
jgi:stage II sporulation protein R